jgi:phospholipid/cholesterol/gamma-HCH transport system substrate-binding protein
MFGHRLGHRRVSAPTIALLLVALCATSCGRPAETSAPSLFCAILRDSVGMYVDNPVTQMGYKIGTVKTIEPRGNDVKVAFTIDERRPIPRDVSAVIRSPSILADRALELVGNYDGGPQLEAGSCVPLSRTSTPLSISQVIGSATNFVNGISPEGSTNLQGALDGVAKAATGNGTAANQLLTRSSALLDNPDQPINDLGEITRNMAQLTSILRANRGPLKQIVQDMAVSNPDVYTTVTGAENLAHALPELVQIVNDIELELGTELQLALDTTSDTLRILSPHYKGIADLLNPLPRFISGLNGEPPGAIAGGLAKHINDHVFALLPYRPPLFRIPTPNGLLTCGIMNSSLPGSCADVGGRPYAVDVALLQYVLTAAANQ